MLLRFVEARLKTLEHVRQRDGVKDDSTAGLLQRKLATDKLGVDEAAAVNAAIVDSHALTPACIDACVLTINDHCDLSLTLNGEPGGKRQNNFFIENYLTNRDWETLADPSVPVACKVHVLAQRLHSIKMPNASETTIAKTVHDQKTKS